MAAAEQSDDQITGINVTPLVDIVLVLLIIFMVTANLIERESIEVDVPRAAPGGPAAPTVMVSLDARGRLIIDGVELAAADAPRKLREVVAKDRDVKAVISGDASLDYGEVVGLVDLVKGAGIEKFALNLQKEAP